MSQPLTFVTLCEIILLQLTITKRNEQMTANLKSDYTICLNSGKLWAHPANYQSTLTRAETLQQHFTEDVVVCVVHIPTDSITDRLYGKVTSHDSHVSLYVEYL